MARNFILFLAFKSQFLVPLNIKIPHKMKNKTAIMLNSSLKSTNGFRNESSENVAPKSKNSSAGKQQSVAITALPSHTAKSHVCFKA